MESRCRLPRACKWLQRGDGVLFEHGNSWLVIKHTRVPPSFHLVSSFFPSFSSSSSSSSSSSWSSWSTAILWVQVVRKFLGGGRKGWQVWKSGPFDGIEEKARPAAWWLEEPCHADESAPSTSTIHLSLSHSTSLQFKQGVRRGKSGADVETEKIATPRPSKSKTNCLTK